MEIWLTAAFGISFGTVNGCARGLVLRVKPMELLVQGVHAADAGPDDGRSVERKRFVDGQVLRP